MASTSPSSVRQALNADGGEFTDDDLEFLIKLAEDLIGREVGPYANEDTSLTTTLVAASYAVGGPGDDAPVSRVKQGNGSISYDTNDVSSASAELWDRAVRQDPSGKLAQLGKPKAHLSVPDARGIDR